MTAEPSKLLQDAQVVLPEEPDVGNAVALRGDPVDAETPREAGPLVRVVADVSEDSGIDGAGTAHLEPACVLAENAPFAVAEKARDVELDGRLGEREVARPHAHVAILPEHRSHEMHQRSLEVGEGDVPVDG